MKSRKHARTTGPRRSTEHRAGHELLALCDLNVQVTIKTIMAPEQENYGWEPTEDIEGLEQSCCIRPDYPRLKNNIRPNTLLTTISISGNIPQANTD